MSSYLVQVLVVLTAGPFGRHSPVDGGRDESFTAASSVVRLVLTVFRIGL